MSHDHGARRGWLMSVGYSPHSLLHEHLLFLGGQRLEGRQ